MGPRRKGVTLNPNRQKNATTSPATDQRPLNSLPPELQQLILDQFSRAFPFSGGAADLKATVQTVKGHLYNRDFSAAFGESTYLDAYAVRWSAARALGYADLFRSLHKEHDLLKSGPDELRRVVVCIGGGAGAEVVGLAATVIDDVDGSGEKLPMKDEATGTLTSNDATSPSSDADGSPLTTADTPSIPSTTQPHSASTDQRTLSITALDIADWSSALTKLQTTLTTPPSLSAYASQAAKAANQPFIQASHLTISFHQQDILSPWPPNLHARLSTANLVTIMFTLNELFTTSLAKTTKMLLQLTEAMKVGSWLLVVDSPGSYSEVPLGASSSTGPGDAATKTKKYPMKWLLDHTLMEVTRGRWEKVLEDDSRWFRVDGGVRYVVELENMRYQVHLYRKTS